MALKDNQNKHVAMPPEDLRFNLTLSGALRSFMYVARWLAAGSKEAGNNMIAAIKREGIRIHSYKSTYTYNWVSALELIKETDAFVQTHYKEWKVDAREYGKIF